MKLTNASNRFFKGSKMKKLFLVFIFITTNALAISNDELIKDFESANIYAADWYEAGTSHIAESQNQYRYIKVNIAPNKASLLVNFREDVNFEIFAVSPCYRIAKLIPYEKAAGWGNEKTTDEKALAKVFNKNIKIGETKSGTLHNWNMQFTRKAQSQVTCTVSLTK